MFTGLVQETGRIESIRRLRAKDGGTITRITVATGNVAKELKIGDSVAVSGVCLTAIETGKKHFCSDLAEETLRRTSLANLRKGSMVNLELPARPQDRLGGHIVQGHADGTARLVRFQQVPGREDRRLVVELPGELTRYVVPQGSITIEGISLTVARIEETQVEIAVIPHTYDATNLRSLQPGDLLNVEVDVLAKYAEKMIRKDRENGLTVPELVKRGF